MATILEQKPSASLQASATTPSYFDIVNSNLLKLGALTLEDFLRDPYQEPTQKETFLSNPLYHDAPVAPSFTIEDKAGEGKSTQMPAPIFVLHQICSQTFGSIDALSYEIIEEEGKESKFLLLNYILSAHHSHLFSWSPLHFNFRKTVHPHHNTSQRCHTLLHFKTRVCAQSRGTRRRCRSGSRHGRN
jgi:hypothetical protein